jgi:hypothetical protein
VSVSYTHNPAAKPAHSGVKAMSRGKNNTEYKADEAYKDCKIINIHRGTGYHKNTVYARLVDKDGKLLLSATLEYITHTLTSRL